MLQMRGLGRIPGQYPGPLAIEILVDRIGKAHAFAHDPAELARLVALVRRSREGARRRGECRKVAGVAQLAVEVPRDEAGSAAREVDVLADQIAVHNRAEVPGDEVG